jgi:regulator of protease activity HflC (stomatin/prohibitin superfamily)
MKKLWFNSLSFMLVLCLSITSCTVVRPGQVALKQKLGKLKTDPLNAGMHFFNPFLTKVLRINVRTVEIYETLPLPTKEGLSVQTQITLLYHVSPEKAKEVYVKFGTNYEQVMVQSNFLATAREVSSRYYAKELYAIEREKVEAVIVSELTEHIGDKGFVVDAVLLKDIILPPAMSEAIQNKVNAEQAALQMEFVIAKQKKEAERLAIESLGIARSQSIIDSTLTSKLLQYNSIQMMKNLITSPNAKIIITDGKVPMMIDPQAK